MDFGILNHKELIIHRLLFYREFYISHNLKGERIMKRISKFIHKHEGRFAAVLMFILGLITVIPEHDATAFIFIAPLSIALFIDSD
jgi:hypothetical protein